MSRAKSERLVNLTLALMASSRFVTVDEIAHLVAGYDPPGGDATDVAFRRKFERDKEELRELGIPVETGPVDPLYGDDIGYRIRRDAYALPPLALETDEAAALGLAARFWTSAELADASASALRKLAAAGAEATSTPAGFETRVDAPETGFGPLTAAVRDRQVVTFDYQRPGGQQARRQVQPWGVVSRRGHWYLIGHDRDRDATRVFRLSRICDAVRPTGPTGAYDIPADIDLRAAVATAAGPEQTRTALLWVRAGTAARLRRRAAPFDDERARTHPAGPTSTPVPDTERDPYPDPDPEGDAPAGDHIQVRYVTDDWFAQELASYGADVVVLTPASLREEVLTLLRGALDA